MIVSRTCTEITAKDADQYQDKVSHPLEAFRDTPAYVLLGDPGAGKTTAFEAERKACTDGHRISARRFIRGHLDKHPEWRDKTLFIDGLDEVRAGGGDPRNLLDQIITKLERLGKPPFRLSCRTFDWLGRNDHKELADIYQDVGLKILQLDPLKRPDIAKILRTRPDIVDAEAFIAAAQDRGVEGFLSNPQSLNLLVDVVTQSGEWPKSRLELFEKACFQMAHEPNDEHAHAAPTLAPGRLLDIAGRLCAIQLMTGTEGYTRHGQPDDDYPALDSSSDGYPDGLRPALSTMLFEGVSDNRSAPVHRHIAEFLGARYLAQIIGDGLPARRVIALMTGGDGTVVTELRGLSAWLAAHCQEARTDLIQRDPIGVGLYGDIREFSLDEKRKFLNSLKCEGTRLDFMGETATAFGQLVTPDLESAFREILNDGNCDHDHQVFIHFILRVLKQATPLPSVSEILLKIIRDDTWRPHVNYAALSAFIHNYPDSQDKTSKLKALLADIHTGSLADVDNELLGTLLTRLYPNVLSPLAVWDYLSEKGDPRLSERYRRFWDSGLVEKSSDEQIAELLDNLKDRLPSLQLALRVHRLDGLPLKLLARGLEVHGDLIKPGRLYGWLGVGSSWDRDSRTSRHGAKPIRHIRAWLEQHPNIQKAIILEGLDRCPDSDEFISHARNVYRHLYGSDLPSDFGRWQLEQAVAKADMSPRVAKYLFKAAFDQGLSLDVLREHTQKNTTLKICLDQLLARQARGEQEELKSYQRLRTFTEEDRQREEKWLEHLRSNGTALRENRASPGLLHELARVYLESKEDALENALRKNRAAVIFHQYRRFELERLRRDSDAWLKDVEASLGGGDHRLIDAALQGLRGTIARKDVPDVDEIVDLSSENRMHYLGWPYLAGLEEIERTAPEEDPAQWDDARIRKGLAFLYCNPLTKNPPEWYQQLLAARPEIVAEVQVQVAASELRRGREHVSKLAELAHDKAHAQVAKHASLPLLRAFPTRCKLGQIENLDYLLWAALQYADRASLWELIDRKLSRRSMNDAQRVYWLASGIIVSPRTYNDRLREFVQGREGRLRQLVKFFYHHGRARPSFPELGAEGSELVVRLVGGYARPDLIMKGWFTPAMEASGLVHDLIQRLVASPDKAASDALASLLADPALSAWRDMLSQAKDTQRVIRRDADYRHPAVEQVCQTLKGGTPANPGDLAALVMDRLGELADRIRNGNTDDWRQYWEGLRGQSPSPKHEDDCRDALLSDLQQRLPQGVDAQPEGHYANDKRADIRVSYGGFQVPVEVKKNTHRDLWRAVRDQLMAKYASDPETDGYGIYLVFWFGKKYTQPSPSGKRPANAEKLKERLEKTLSADERRKISVCVIDVSKP